MGFCRICGGVRKGFFMKDKLVCMRCDELVFDMEIECDMEEQTSLSDIRPVEGIQPHQNVQITITKK